MEKLCYCCPKCIESEKHKCDGNTFKFDDIKKENNLDDNIYEIRIRYCYHDETSILEKKIEISNVFKEWTICCDKSTTRIIRNFVRMSEKGYYCILATEEYIHTVHINSFGHHYWEIKNLNKIVDKIKIGSLITLNCDVSGLSDFYKLISDRFWKLKKIGRPCKFNNYVIVQEELVTKVALK